MPKDLKIYSFLDPAISEKQEADYTAIVTIGIDTNNRIYVLDIIQERMNPTDIINAVFSTYMQWKPTYFGIEVVAYQKMLALEIRKQMNLRNIFFNLMEVTPMGEKNARIRTLLQPRYGNASIIHPKYHNKIKELELELLKFPNAKHDDIIDALSACLKISQVQSS